MTPIEITESPRAISCVEAGVDFSFRSAFRDLSACPAQAGSWGLVNLLQIAGRTAPPGIADWRLQISEVITADTRAVLVEQALVKRIESRDRAQFPSWREIMQNSVQIWSSRLKSGDWPLKPIGLDEELWAWTGQNFNGFLGYMADVLPLLKAGKTGFDVL